MIAEKRINENEKLCLTHNIANGGDCSKFGHCSPFQNRHRRKEIRLPKSEIINMIEQKNTLDSIFLLIRI